MPIATPQIEVVLAGTQGSLSIASDSRPHPASVSPSVKQRARTQCIKLGCWVICAVLTTSFPDITLSLGRSLRGSPRGRCPCSVFLTPETLALAPPPQQTSWADSRRTLAGPTVSVFKSRDSGPGGAWTGCILSRVEPGDSAGGDSVELAGRVPEVLPRVRGRMEPPFKALVPKGKPSLGASRRVLEMRNASISPWSGSS